MRQAGFVPKGHNSGIYWVRANATSISSSLAKKEKEINSMEENPWATVKFVVYATVFSVIIFSFIAVV